MPEVLSEHGSLKLSSHRGLASGALIIPYYFSVLGLCLVGLAHRNFWKLTAKSLLSMIAISVVVGMVTYNMTTTISIGVVATATTSICSSSRPQEFGA